MSAHILILAAVNEEIAGIKQRMTINQKMVMGHATCWEGTWEGYAILLMRTGIGRVRAVRALQAVLEKYQVVLTLSIGFAGGLDEALSLGDLVLADTVLELEPAGPGAQATATEYALDSGLVNQAMLLSCPEGATLHRGGLVTVDTAVTQPEDKRALGERFKASAVDMETSALVKQSREKDLPLVSIRAISDTVDQELADLGHLVKDDGEVDMAKASWHILTHPTDLPKALSLKSQCQQAEANLTQFVSGYLKNLK